MPITAVYTFSQLHTVCFLAGFLSEFIWAAVTECHGQSELYSADMFCLVALGVGYQQIWSLVRDCFLSIVACFLTLSSKTREDSLVSLCVDISYTDELVYVWDVLLSNTITLQVRVSVYKCGAEYQQLTMVRLGYMGSSQSEREVVMGWSHAALSTIYYRAMWVLL